MLSVKNGLCGCRASQSPQQLERLVGLVLVPQVHVESWKSASLPRNSPRCWVSIIRAHAAHPVAPGHAGAAIRMILRKVGVMSATY